MKTDSRVRYTKMVLKNNLLELLKQKPINKVTVKDICDLAELNRATFYCHYNDPFDLLDSIEKEFTSEIIASLEKMELNNIPRLLDEIFEAIRKNAELCNVLFSEFGDKEFLRTIIYVAHDDTITQWRRIKPKAKNDQFEQAYTFFANGCVAIIQRWVQGGMKENPNDLSVFIEKIIMDGLKSL